MPVLELHDGLLAVTFKDARDLKLIDPTTQQVRYVLYGALECLAELDHPPKPKKTMKSHF